MIGVLVTIVRTVVGQLLLALVFGAIGVVLAQQVAGDMVQRLGGTPQMTVVPSAPATSLSTPVVRPGATVARREGRADREASPTPDLQPYVAARDYIRAHANVRGQQYDVIVLGSRGERVYLSWRPDMGRHLGWVPAADGERQPS